MAILDCFRGALKNCGNERVKFTTEGQLKRRKSRTHALDVPSGMHRNLSESHLVQAGSKVVINFADQFSKLGHSLNPKILMGKKTNSSDQSTSSPPTDELVNQSKYTVKAESHEICNICRAKFNDNSFMKGVGIVMVDAAEMAETQNQTEPRINKNQENVAHISISSVTDNVKLPPEMLEVNDIPGRSPTPQINVQETEERSGEKNPSLKMCHSVADMRSDAIFADDCERYETFVRLQIKHKEVTNMFLIFTF